MKLNINLKEIIMLQTQIANHKDSHDAVKKVHVEITESGKISMIATDGSVLGMYKSELDTKNENVTICNPEETIRFSVDTTPLVKIKPIFEKSMVLNDIIIAEYKDDRLKVMFNETDFISIEASKETLFDKSLQFFDKDLYSEKMSGEFTIDSEKLKKVALGQITTVRPNYKTIENEDGTTETKVHSYMVETRKDNYTGVIMGARL